MVISNREEGEGLAKQLQYYIGWVWSKEYLRILCNTTSVGLSKAIIFRPLSVVLKSTRHLTSLGLMNMFASLPFSDLKFSYRLKQREA